MQILNLLFLFKVISQGMTQEYFSPRLRDSIFCVDLSNIVSINILKRVQYGVKTILKKKRRDYIIRLIRLPEHCEEAG